MAKFIRKVCIIGRPGQLAIVIPAAVKLGWDLKAGDLIEIMDKEDTLIIKRLKKQK